MRSTRPVLSIVSYEPTHTCKVIAASRYAIPLLMPKVHSLSHVLGWALGLRQVVKTIREAFRLKNVLLA